MDASLGFSHLKPGTHVEKHTRLAAKCERHHNGAVVHFNGVIWINKIVHCKVTGSMVFAVRDSDSSSSCRSVARALPTVAHDARGPAAVYWRLRNSLGARSSPADKLPIFPLAGLPRGDRCKGFQDRREGGTPAPGVGSPSRQTATLVLLARQDLDPKDRAISPCGTRVAVSDSRFTGVQLAGEAPGGAQSGTCRGPRPVRDNRRSVHSWLRVINRFDCAATPKRICKPGRAGPARGDLVLRRRQPWQSTFRGFRATGIS